MSRNKAIKLAIDALKKQRKPYTFNANLYKRGIIRSFRTEEDAKKYDEYSEAIRILEND